MNEEEKIARVARAAHNALVTYNRLHGDYALKEWEDAEGWQRDDTITMVKSILAGNYSPRAEHNRWLDGKKAKGYVYGAVKNDDKNAGPLTNPSMLDYDQIPVVLLMKNHLQIVVTVGIAAHYGLKAEKTLDLIFA